MMFPLSFPFFPSLVLKVLNLVRNSNFGASCCFCFYVCFCGSGFLSPPMKIHLGIPEERILKFSKDEQRERERGRERMSVMLFELKRESVCEREGKL